MISKLTRSLGCGRALPLLLAAGVAGLAGCGGASFQSRQAVSGNVSIGTRPLPFAQVDFVPVDGAQPGQTAVITDGRFEIPSESGLRPGQYHVLVHPYEPESEELQALSAERKQDIIASRKLIPERFQKPGAQTIAIEAGKPNVVTVDLASTGP